MTIQKNLDTIKPFLNGQTIIAATKYVEADKIKELYTLGIDNIGENRVQDFLRKFDLLTDLPIKWHFIGHLQTNKVKMMINKIDYLHSLDSLKLANAIQKERMTQLPCFIEVLLTNEPNKTGILPSEVFDFVQSLKQYDIISVVGLMGMAKANGSEAEVKKSFDQLRELRNEIANLNLPYAPCKWLSMGMSDDYQIAIECEATHLRLGSILFRNEE
ncbi:MAG: YggS family pyridoxal phosphate-dependent enzyme [Tenericutes bacterium HGW-Tenericutes-1]|jgi:hypothetical protein|nr:MAG: YggS family pyridoxal phosphate-dependent enzyme [Tenericutes bacterium HGW-Tenericutes-1]